MRSVFAIGAIAAITLGLQWYATGGDAEFSLYADEPAHYVTGLMFTEYIRQGFPESPIRFAEQFYVHYPKVAIGSWPPVFYGVQALWSLPFGSSKPALYCLIALIFIGIAGWLFLLARGILGTAGAFLLALVFLLLPMTQELLPMMMSDPLVAFWTLGATVFFARYWETGRYRDASLYALFAGLTVLTKGSGVSLVLIPVCAIVLTRRWRMVLDKPLWVAAGIVAILGGPWTVFSLRIVQDGWQQEMPLSTYMLDALWRVPWWHIGNLTIPIGMIFLLGSWRMIRRSDSPVSPLLLSAASTVLAVLIFHILTPVGMEPRRIFMAIPQSLLIAAYGLVWLRVRLPAQRFWQLAPSLMLVAVAGVSSLPPVKKPYYGYDQAAQYIHTQAGWRDCVSLVSSEADGEGMLISEMAVLENVPRRYILRSSKMLASANWNGRDYQAKVRSDEELVRLLDQSPVNVVVFDTYAYVGSKYHFPHHQLLGRVLESNEQWEKVAGFTGTGVPGAISFYKHRTKACVANPGVEVDLSRKIQRAVTSKP